MEFERLLRRVRKKDASAFRELVYLFSTRLMTIAKMMAKNNQDAEDILQESFILIYEKLSQFDGTQEAAFYAWSKKIVMNKGLSFYRRKYYSLENLIPLKNEHIEKPEVFDNLDKQEFMNLIYQLPIKYKQVVCLYAIEGYSHAEIAKMMGISEGTSRSNYSRAKKKLSKMIHNPTPLFQKINIS